jgi:dihydrofolate reductase
MNNISIIAAVGSNYELGKDNKLLWHISADLRRFKNITSGHTVIMGRKTFESLEKGALPNRRNIVFTANPKYKPEGAEVVHNIEELLKAVNLQNEVFVVGGGTIYKLLLPYTQHMYLTFIHQSYNADAFFPAFDLEDWKEEERIDIKDDQQAGVNYSFVTYVRKPVN